MEETGCVETRDPARHQQIKFWKPPAAPSESGSEAGLETVKNHVKETNKVTFLLSPFHLFLSIKKMDINAMLK